MMRHLEAAFAFDIHVRRDIDERIGLLSATWRIGFAQIRNIDGHLRSVA
jgi:hypothetical protein